MFTESSSRAIRRPGRQSKPPSCPKIARWRSTRSLWSRKTASGAGDWPALWLRIFQLTPATPHPMPYHRDMITSPELSPELQEKKRKLDDSLRALGRALVAYSGGVDSAY